MDKSILEKAKKASTPKWSKKELNELTGLAVDPNIDSKGAVAVKKMTAYKNRTDDSIRNMFSRIRREQR